MLLRNRPPDIDTTPVTLQPGLEHLDQGWVAVLRWLNANKVDYVVVGPAAYAIRGELTARGPVGIVPAPYSRNYERLTKALVAQNAGLRGERPGQGGRPTSQARAAVEVELTADKLARGKRWLLRFAGYDLDVENAARTGNGDDAGVRYQELLYETGRFELAPGLLVEVAAPEDLELFAHLRRTGSAPEFRISRAGAREAADAERPAEPSNSADS